MSTFQVAKSLSGLLLTSQRSVDGDKRKIANYLSRLARFIMDL